MLLNLHVKDLAIIYEVDVNFERGLNILTGETGAGKSIIIESINIALGGKVPKDMIRKHAEYAYIELLFLVEDSIKLEALKALDVLPDKDGQLIVSKKIMTTRSVSKINDETVTTAKMRQITSLLIDIHGQHEHQSLLYKSKHLEILDEYAKSQITPIKLKTADAYKQYSLLKDRLEQYSMDYETRRREIDFYTYEIDEIENLGLKSGEVEELTASFRRLSNARKIVSGLYFVHDAIGTEREHSASELIGKALRELNQAAEYDEALKSIRDQLCDVDDILSDINREITGYLDSQIFDDLQFIQIEERLNHIHNIMAKYGDTYEKVNSSLEEKKKKKKELEEYDILRETTIEELNKVTKELEKNCKKLSELRKKSALLLTEKIKEELKDLNFLDVIFSMDFERLNTFNAKGYDEVQFMISTNPGEEQRPLSMVASGGELSRIMLAVKTVLADTDDIQSLIFDEIDTGISGRTAQKVSEKLSYIGKSHQVICITHLPQIAAMADTHFEIVKKVSDGFTTTSIQKLKDDNLIVELARLLGGAKITDTVMESAKEMKELADRTKNC